MEHSSREVSSSPARVVSAPAVGSAILWCYIIALLLFVTGYSSPVWLTAEHQKTGVWETCTCYDVKDKTSWQTGVQLTATFGLACLCVCLVAFGLYVFVRSYNAFLVVTVIFTFVSVFSLFIALIVFGHNTNYFGGQLEFGYVFVTIGTILTLISGILTMVYVVRVGLFDNCRAALVG